MHPGDKLTLRFRCLLRAVAALSDHVFEIDDLGTGIVCAEHASKLRFFRDDQLDVTPELLSHIAHN
jgi:hypothetical protein